MKTKKSECKLVVVDYCRNCLKNLPPNTSYCDSCGGKIIKNRITFKNLLEDFNDRFLSIDGAFPKTFLALFTKPEDVIGGYINGVRKRYMSAFGYFALSLSIAGIYVFIIREYFIDDLFEEMALPVTQNQIQMDLVKKITLNLNEYQALYSILTVPIYALISRIVFWNYKQFNYLEHMVIYLYAFSHINLIFYVLVILTMWSSSLYSMFSFLAMFAYIIYTCYVLKRLYRLSMFNLIAKTALFALIGSVFLIIILTLVGTTMYKLGMFDELFESLKQAEASQA